MSTEQSNACSAIALITATASAKPKKKSKEPRGQASPAPGKKPFQRAAAEPTKSKAADEPPAQGRPKEKKGTEKKADEEDKRADDDENERVKSILLDSPSCSECRVSFDFKPKVKEITPFNPIAEKDKQQLKRPSKGANLKFEVEDKKLIIKGKVAKIIKQKATKFLALVPSSGGVTLKYKRREDMEADMRALGLIPKTYIENKLIVHNLSFKETEESVRKYFSELAEVEKVILEKNSKGLCTGKGVVTFSSAFYPGQEKRLYDLRLSGRLLRIERIKKQIMNRTRLFISHIKKNIKISDLRAILKKAGFVPKSVKIDLNDNRNKGYGFVEFNTPQQAERFMKGFGKVQTALGEDSFVEYSQEKPGKV